MMTILLLMFLFQFLPKVYHSIYLMRQMQKVTGYIFGTIWWRFVLNLIAYLIASHVIYIYIYRYIYHLKILAAFSFFILYYASSTFDTHFDHRLLEDAGMFLQYNAYRLVFVNSVTEIGAIYLCLAQRTYATSFSY